MDFLFSRLFDLCPFTACPDIAHPLYILVWLYYLLIRLITDFSQRFLSAVAVGHTNPLQTLMSLMSG